MDKYKAHWERIYTQKTPDDVSWFQAQPSVSVAIIESLHLNYESALMDVGGGASSLVDHLLGAGFTNLTVLDISQAALAHARNRLQDAAEQVTWIEDDVTGFRPRQHYAVWHDRAVFHFLTEKEDRIRYLNVMDKAVTAGGFVIIATFALDGPARCSGLDVIRYNAVSIRAELGEGYTLIDTVDEFHRTPSNTEQHFSYFVFQRGE